MSTMKYCTIHSFGYNVMFKNPTYMRKTKHIIYAYRHTGFFFFSEPRDLERACAPPPPPPPPPLSSPSKHTHTYILHKRAHSFSPFRPFFASAKPRQDETSLCLASFPPAQSSLIAEENPPVVSDATLRSSLHPPLHLLFARMVIRLARAIYIHI